MANFEVLGMCTNFMPFARPALLVVAAVSGLVLR